MIKRKCANWLTTFKDWSIPRSEAPESFHFWTGLFTLSSVLKRKIKIGKRLLGGWECYPFLYVIFVAPPGVARKSTTARYSEELLSDIPTVNLAPTSTTIEKMLNSLSESQDASISIFSSEFAMFVQKSKSDMYDALTDLFDGKTDIAVEILSRKKDFAQSPCVNLLAATTPEWIADNMPENVIGGGFASRVIFVFEERARRYQLYYESIDHKYLRKLQDDLVADLMHIAVDIEGEFDLDPDAKSFMEAWYKAEQKKFEDTPVNYRLSGYYQRKPAHIHKIAMLMHLAYSDELILYKHDFEGAIAILKGLEINLPKTFQNIGKNPYTMDMDRIYDFIVVRGRVQKKDVYSAFYHVAQPAILAELLGALIAMDKVRVEGMEQGEPIFKAVV